jgi:hypothetical protein
MLLPRTGLPDSYINNTTPYDGGDIERVHGMLENGLVPLFMMIGAGVSHRYGATAFKATANGTSSVSIAAGSGIATSFTYGAVPLEKNAATILNGLAVSSTLYLFAMIEVSDFNNSRKTGIPLFDTNISNAVDGGLLLAKLDIDGAGVVTVTDQRQACGIPAMADADALPNQLYYSTTISKLAYKNPVGVVNALY